jgi:hypothetical protein
MTKTATEFKTGTFLILAVDSPFGIRYIIQEAGTKRTVMLPSGIDRWDIGVFTHEVASLICADLESSNNYGYKLI